MYKLCIHTHTYTTSITLQKKSLVMSPRASPQTRASAFLIFLRYLKDV